MLPALPNSIEIYQLGAESCAELARNTHREARAGVQDGEPIQQANSIRTRYRRAGPFDNIWRRLFGEEDYAASTCVGWCDLDGT